MALPLLTRRILLAAPVLLSVLAAPHAGAAVTSAQAAPHARAAVTSAQAAPHARAAVTAGQAGVRAGTIEGVVSLDIRPARRTAARYPGRAAAAQEVQQLPALVWIAGALPGASPAALDAASIAQQDTTFVPGALVVPVGTHVAFPNRDPFFHNVFSFSAAQRFDLGRYPRGESKTVTFTEPGVVKVYCEVHESMRALVVVTENPFHAVVGEDGRFTLRGVPAGSHTLVLLHADLGTIETTVDVPEGGVAQVRLKLP